MASQKHILSGIFALLIAASAAWATNLTEQDYRDLDSAHLALQQGRFEHALELLGPLYESYPQNAEINNNFAVALFNSGRSTEAGLVLQDYLQSHNEVSVASNNLFRVYDFVAAESYSMLTGSAPERPELVIASPTPLESAATIPTPVLLASTETTSMAATEIEQRLQEYLNAWSDGDADAYFSYYFPNRSPVRGQSYTSWKTERSGKVFPERNIAVAANDLQVMPIDDSQAIAVFRQSYRARNYQDETTKQLTWLKDGDQWYIRYEMALPN